MRPMFHWRRKVQRRGKRKGKWRQKELTQSKKGEEFIGDWEGEPFRKEILWQGRRGKGTNDILQPVEKKKTGRLVEKSVGFDFFLAFSPYRTSSPGGKK